MSAPGAWRGYALVLAAATFWATGGLTARWLFVGDLAVDPTDLAAARAVTAFLILLVIAPFGRRDRLRVTMRDLPFLAVFGIAGQALLHLAYFKAIAIEGVATAILLEYLAPVIVLAVSVAFMGERLTWQLPAGVVTAVAGCAMVVGVGGSGLAVSSEGLAWGLAAAGLFAVYMLLGKVAADRFSPWTLLTYGLGFASVFWLLVNGGPSPVWEILSTRTGALAVAYVAVVSTILPFGLFLVALRRIGATHAGVTSTVEPVIAAAGGYLLFSETLTPAQLAGAALVVAAIVVVQSPGPRPAPLPPAA